ncbi:md-2-related lipid-recognition protein rosy1 [Anaeramoeba ignava]|uniref:Md-2-related lipid-recognition protein rosy1 n=1 Tax=Anaeramoeba ignava TaxID=1746090 RepID=A0A9Q0LRF6_ANAIG|nr:md-2-related lipid-recognition protein rosy1 [Anaeramoeba ignava]
MNWFIYKILVLFFISLSLASVEWDNCGVSLPITIQNIDYSPSNAVEIDSLLNVTVTIDIQTGYSIPTGSQLKLQVWVENFNGDPIISDYFPICSISDQIHCPVSAGQLLFKEVNLQVPEFPVGHYKAKLEFFNGTTELGCSDIYWTIWAPEPPPTCYFQSSTVASGLNSDFHYEHLLPKDRLVNDWVQVGSLGPEGPFVNGNLTGFTATNDNTFGMNISSMSFEYALNATLTQIVNGNTFSYSGLFWVGSAEMDMNTWSKCFWKGEITFNASYSTTTGEVLSMTGEITVDPGSSYPPAWPGPQTFGKLNPIKISYVNSDQWGFHAQREICQCTIDNCGVCGGDGSSCATSTSKSSNAGAIAAGVIVPVVVIVGVVFGVIYYKKKKREHHIRETVMSSEIGDTENWTKITN